MQISSFAHHKKVISSPKEQEDVILDFLARTGPASSSRLASEIRQMMGYTEQLLSKMESMKRVYLLADGTWGNPEQRHADMLRADLRAKPITTCASSSKDSYKTAWSIDRASATDAMAITSGGFLSPAKRAQAQPEWV